MHRYKYMVKGEGPDGTSLIQYIDAPNIAEAAQKAVYAWGGELVYGIIQSTGR